MDVYFYEAFAEEVEALRRHLPASVRAEFTAQTIQETGHATPPASLISIRTQSIVPSDWKLAGILSRTTGYDHLVGSKNANQDNVSVVAPFRVRSDKRRLKPATTRFVGDYKTPCGYLPLYCNRAVAEQAALLWMALLRNLPEQMRQFSNFNRDGLTGRECAGKNLLVVGAGNIGGEVVTIGRGLSMNVRRVDIIPQRADVSIEEGLPWADVIVCAMNLTPQNTGYFNYARLKRAKRGVIFVNIARGEQSPTADLVRVLDEGHLGGVALDVFEDEPNLATVLRAGQGRFQLTGRPNVICTPHNAFNTSEAVERKAAQTTQQIEHFLETGKFLWPVP